MYSRAFVDFTSLDFCCGYGVKKNCFASFSGLRKETGAAHMSRGKSAGTDRPGANRSFTGRFCPTLDELVVVDHVSPCTIVPVIPRLHNSMGLVDCLIPITIVTTCPSAPPSLGSKGAARTALDRNEEHGGGVTHDFAATSNSLQSSLSQVYAAHLTKIRRVPNLLLGAAAAGSSSSTNNERTSSQAASSPPVNGLAQVKTETTMNDEPGQGPMDHGTTAVTALVQWVDGTISVTGDLDGLHTEEYLRACYKHYSQLGFLSEAARAAADLSSTCHDDSKKCRDEGDNVGKDMYSTTSYSSSSTAAELSHILREQTRRLMSSALEDSASATSHHTLFSSSANDDDDKKRQLSMSHHHHIQYCRIAEQQFSVACFAEGIVNNSTVSKSAPSCVRVDGCDQPQHHRSLMRHDRRLLERHRLKMDRYFLYGVAFTPSPLFPQLSSSKHDIVAPFSEVLQRYLLSSSRKQPSAAPLSPPECRRHCPSSRRCVPEADEELVPGEAYRKHPTKRDRQEAPRGSARQHTTAHRNTHEENEIEEEEEEEEVLRCYHHRELPWVRSVWTLTLDAISKLSSRRINVMMTVIRLSRSPQSRSEYVDDIRAILGSYYGLPDVTTMLNLLREEPLFQGLRWPNGAIVTAARQSTEIEVLSVGGRPPVPESTADRKEVPLYTEYDLLGGDSYFVRLSESAGVNSTSKSSSCAGGMMMAFDGPTTLAFNTTRQFLLKNGRSMTYDELLKVATCQK